jgi:hypothetical protein
VPWNNVARVVGHRPPLGVLILEPVVIHIDTLTKRILLLFRPVTVNNSVPLFKVTLSKPSIQFILRNCYQRSSHLYILEEKTLYVYRLTLAQLEDRRLDLDLNIEHVVVASLRRVPVVASVHKHEPTVPHGERTHTTTEYAPLASRVVEFI